MLSYKGFSLIKPNDVQRKMISQIIEERNGSVFHEIELNKIGERHFGSNLFYLVDNPKNITNFSPIHITKGRFGLNRYHLKPLFDIPYAGFIDDRQIDFSAFSIGLFESLNYRGSPREEKEYNNPKLLSFGETCTVDLTLEEDDIFNNIIHTKRRNMIRKAIKSKISTKYFFSEEGLIYFWPMLDELHKKLGFEHLSKEYYTDLINSYGLKKQACILVAFKDEEPISGIFILGNKNHIFYYKGASVYGVKNEGQGELLQWEAIKTAKSMDAHYYDLCNLDKEGLPFIYKFKTGISNNIVKYPIYSKNSLGYKIVNRIYNKR